VMLFSKHILVLFVSISRVVNFPEI